MAHSPNSTPLPTSLALPVRPRVVQKSSVNRKENAEGSSGTLEASVIARARLQPVSSPASSGSSKNTRRFIITGSQKPVPHAQPSSSTSNRPSAGQRLLPLVTTALSPLMPKPTPPPSASTSSKSPIMTMGLASSSSVASSGNTPSTTVVKKRFSYSSKPGRVAQRPILPKVAPVPMMIPANSPRISLEGSPMIIPASSSRLELPPKLLPMGTSRTSTSGNVPALSSGPETVFLLHEIDEIGMNGKGSVGIGGGSVEKGLHTAATPYHDYAEPSRAAPSTPSLSGTPLSLFRTMREWTMTLRGQWTYGHKFERLIKQAKEALSSRCKAQGGNTAPDYFTNEMILIDALESLIAKVAADERMDAAKIAARAPPDPVTAAERDIIELNAAERDGNFFVTSPTDLSYLLNRVAEHHRGIKCDATKWSVVGMSRRGHCMDLTLDCLKKSHKRIRWTSSVPFLINANHAGRSFVNDRLADALKKSEMNQKAYRKFCDLAGIGHLSERYLERVEQNPDQLDKRKRHLKERLDAAVVKRIAANTPRPFIPDSVQSSSPTKRTASSSAARSVATAGIEVVRARAGNSLADQVKTECQDEDAEADLSLIGEPNEGNWSCLSSDSSVPVEFVEDLSMEFSDTQECPICRQLVEDIDFASHVEKCSRGSGRKRLAIAVETSAASKKVRSEFDSHGEPDVKPLIRRV